MIMNEKRSVKGIVVGQLVVLAILAGFAGAAQKHDYPLAPMTFEQVKLKDDFWLPRLIIPWSHAVAILKKGMYPQTYASSALTGSIATDLIFHLGYLVVVILISIYIASRVFERESILT